MLQIPHSSDHTLPIHLRRVGGKTCDLQRFSGLVQPGSVCLNSLGLISTPFSKILGVSAQGKPFPMYLGSHTGGELPASPFCLPAQCLHCKQHIIPSQVSLGPAWTDDKSGACRQSIPSHQRWAAEIQASVRERLLHLHPGLHFKGITDTKEQSTKLFS